jgi:hypothetical protein
VANYRAGAAFVGGSSVDVTFSSPLPNTQYAVTLTLNGQDVGVDASVYASLLATQGFHIYGLTFSNAPLCCGYRVYWIAIPYNQQEEQASTKPHAGVESHGILSDKSSGPNRA